MMNVASGGSLCGDIPTEISTTVIHRKNWEVMQEIAIVDTCTLIFPRHRYLYGKLLASSRT